MLLTLAALSAIGGILYRNTKLYQKNKENNSTDKENNNKEISLLTPHREFKKEILKNYKKYPKNESDKRLDQALVVSFINVGILGVSFFYPPLIILTVPGILYASLPVYEVAYKAVFKEKRISSYFLDATLITGALAGGFLAPLAAGGWMGLVGLKLMRESENTTKTNLSNLFGVQPRSVLVMKLTDENIEMEIEIPFESLKIGDIVIVIAGQSIPIDGKIKTGYASIDQHKLTGEAQPIEKGVGDFVLSSTIVLSGKLHIEVEKTGEETVAMQIGKILNETMDFKDSMQMRGLRIADRMVLPTAGLSLILLPVLGMNSALAVLTNKFGSKMRDLSPANMLVFLNFACLEGILIKDGRSLELLNDIDTIVFDKTGTLTLEQPTVNLIHNFNGFSEEEVLTYAAAAENGQTHPVAKAILQIANQRKLKIPEIDHTKYDIGYGIQVNLPNRVVRVGSKKFMLVENILLPSKIKPIEDVSSEEGHSLVYIAFDEQLVGIIELIATIRPEAKQIIEQLRKRNMNFYIISGDHEAPTKKLAKLLKIDNYFADTLPENKAKLIESLREEGKSVCFIGDGINDTIALKKANVSVSLHGATTIATDTAQVVLMDGTLKQLCKMFDIAAGFQKNMQNNYIITTAPTIISLTGILFFHWGFFTAVILSNSSMFLGIANTMRPIFLKQKTKNPK